MLRQWLSRGTNADGRRCHGARISRRRTAMMPHQHDLQRSAHSAARLVTHHARVGATNNAAMRTFERCTARATSISADHDRVANGRRPSVLVSDALWCLPPAAHSSRHLRRQLSSGGRHQSGPRPRCRTICPFRRSQPPAARRAYRPLAPREAFRALLLRSRRPPPGTARGC